MKSAQKNVKNTQKPRILNKMFQTFHVFLIYFLCVIKEKFKLNWSQTGCSKDVLRSHRKLLESDDRY